jgi:hypothetical protein
MVCRPSAGAASGAHGARFFGKTLPAFAEISQNWRIERTHAPVPEMLRASTSPRTRAPARAPFLGIATIAGAARGVNSLSNEARRLR